MGGGSRGLAAEWAALTEPGPRAAWFVGLGAVLGALQAPVLASPLTLGSLTSGHMPLQATTQLGIAVVAAGLAIFGACTVWLTHTDVRERRLPNPVVVLATIGLMAPLALASLSWGSATRLGWSLAAAAVLMGVTFIAWWCAPGAIGGGDVKLTPSAAFLAAWVHPVAGPLLFTLLVCGAVVITGAVALARRRASLPFGPILLGAGWIAAVCGARLGSVAWV